MGGERLSAEAELLPPPSAELVLIRVLVTAHLATSSKRRGEAFLRHAAELLASEEGVASLFPIRSRPQRGELALAHRQAVAVFHQLAPVFAEAVAARE